jgi:ribonuclease J
LAKASTISFYGGVKEIGGNMFLVEDKGTRVFLDFGMPMGRAGGYFWDYVQPRAFNGMNDLIEFGLLPKLEGIYRRDYAKHTSFGDHNKDTALDAVLLTHAHVDHVGYMGFLRPEIPIYCTEGTRLILQALDDTGSYEYLTYTEQFKTYVNKNGERSRAKSSEHRDETPREVKTVQDGKTFRIDSIEVEPVAIDHSLPGVAGFILHTSNASIACTADIRFHGRRAKESDRFIERCAKSDLDVLLCEGTRILETNSKTELDVEDGVKKVVNETKNLVVSTYPVRDLDRLLSFHRAALATGRNLVIDVKQAHILELFNNSTKLKGRYPSPHAKGIKVYLPRKSWGLLGKKSTEWDEKLRTEDYRDLERDWFERGDYVDHQYVGSHQKDTIFFLSDYRLQELIDVLPKAGSTYIRSTTEPYDDEQELNEQNIRNWTDHFGLKWSGERLHVSGHGDQSQIGRLVQETRAGFVVPIHTEHEELFQQWHGDVRTVGLNDTIEVEA